MQKHGIGQNSGLNPDRRIGQHVVNIFENERLATGEKYIAEPERYGFINQALHVGQSQRPTGYIGAGFGHAVGTAQVAIIACVEPELPHKSR
ncbi:MAG: hypothetical protein P8183_15935 [Anaerolineae bacterium]